MKLSSPFVHAMLIMAVSLSMAAMAPISGAGAQDQVPPLDPWTTTLIGQPTANPVTADLNWSVIGGLEPYHFEVATQPSKGHVTITRNGLFAYEWEPGSKGYFWFTYRVTDSQHPSASAIGRVEFWIGVDYIPDVTVTVAGDPRFPVTGSAAIPGYTGLTYAVETGPSNGSMVLAADGSFEYVAFDSGAVSDTFTVTTRPPWASIPGDCCPGA
jgi:hypothetical protein